MSLFRRRTKYHESINDGGYMLRGRYYGILACLAVIGLVLIAMRLMVEKASASVSSASEVIQLVNQLRRANGLPAYQQNASLMAAAQSHSEYQASIGSVTHTGAGGTRARDRAVAAGYGDGATVFVSENIAGGVNLSAQEAVQWWQGDNLHLNTMLSASYQDVGVGVAVSDSRVYYTLDAGYIASSAPPPPSGGTSAPSPPQVTPGPTAIVIIPVQAATARPDGSIVHEVQQGQALWNIAAAYKVSIAYLLTLNSITESSIIYPGDKLLVRVAQVNALATETQIITVTATLDRVAATSHPNRTPTPDTPSGTLVAGQATPSASDPDDALANSTKQEGARPKFDPLLIAIIALGVIGAGLFVFGTILKRKD